jgi:DNA-binding CsgD family transcriptional regulator
MARLDPKQRIAFSRLLGVCAKADDVTVLLTKVSQLLRAAIGASAYCTSQLDPTTGLLLDAVADNWPDEAKPLLLDKVLLRTPAADPYHLFQRGYRAVDVRMLLRDAENINDDPYFEFHLRPFGYQYEVQCLCSADSSPQVILTFSRAAASGCFGADDLRLLSAAAPHVGKAVRRIDIASMREAVPGSASGVILARTGGDIVYASDLARDWLNFSNHEHPWRLDLQLAIRLATGPPERLAMISSIVLRSPENGALYRLRLDESQTQAGIVALFLEPARPIDAVDTLRRLGLSAREAGVALNLVRGLDVKSIAAALGCTPNTINQHKKQVFDKLDISSRLELACALLGPAPV